jgi:hypothetical protein
MLKNAQDKEKHDELIFKDLRAKLEDNTYAMKAMGNENTK